MSVKNFVSKYLPSSKIIDILTQVVFLPAEYKKNVDNVVTVRKTF